jgi:RNA polymerase sigma-70 factor (ECF subfamily)
LLKVIGEAPRSDEAMVAAHPDGTTEVGCVTEESDRALMARLREGDALALHRLMHSYWKPLVARARAILADEDAAADAAQQTFIALWQRRAQWRETGSVSGLLFRMVRNVALNDRRTRRSRARSDAARIGSRAATPCTPLQALEERELRAALMRAIGRLPARRKQVYVLSRDHELSHQEISTLMGISPQTVANQMTLAMADLRLSLRDNLDAG